MTDQPPRDAGVTIELSSVLDSIPVPIFFKDRQGRYTGFNRVFRDQYLRDFGTGAEHMLGLTCHDTAQGDANAAVSADTDRRVLEEGETCAYLIPHVFPDGKEHRLLCRKAPYRDPASGEITGIATMVLDVTELTAVQQALAVSERNYRELVENSNTIIMGMDPNGCITFCNEFGEQFFGFTEGEILGRPAVGLLVPAVEESGRDLRELVAAIASDPDRYRHVENENLTADGRRVWISWTNTAIYDANGQVAGLRTVGHDITARKQMEQQLRISEAAIESSREAIGIADLNGIILQVNQAYLDFWGCQSRDEVVGLPVQEFMVSADREDIIESIRKGGWTGERESRRRDGSPFYMRISANLVRDDRGRPLCLMASLQDVTQRKLAELELAKFKLISDTATYGSVIIGPEAEIRYCNQAFADMHGYTIEELLGQSLAMLHAEDQWDEVIGLGQKLRREGHLSAERVWRKRKDGLCFPSLLSVHYIPGGEPEQLRAGSLVDITELDQAISALSEQKERLAVTLASIADGVIATDVAGRITLMNPVAEALTGWTQTEALGRPLREVCQALAAANPPGPLTVIDEVLATRQVTELPPGLVLVGRDGRERHVAGVAAPTQDDEGRLLGAVLAVRDITEQERLRQEAYQAHKLESLGILAGGIAHDFNNLLTSILGGISLAQPPGSHPAEAIEGLQTAERAAQLARHLSQQLLTFSRGGDPIRRPLRLDEMIRGSADMALSGTNCTAQLCLPDDLWPVEADAAQLAQALNNALLNAVQAMPGGGVVEVAAENVEIGATDPPGLPRGRQVRLRVSDQGVGIDPEVLPRVFDPYFTTKDRGSGLGLTIAYSVVMRHDGHIAIASRRGEGTTLTIHLPASEEQPPDQAQLPQGVLTGAGRVLVMDDDPFVRRVVGPMLHHLGYEPEVVADTEAAIAVTTAAAADERPFAAAILDLTIRGGPGGAQVVGTLQGLNPGLKTLACSGYHDDPIMSNAAASGFDGVLIKPYQVRDLGQTLRALLSAPGEPLTAAGQNEAGPCRGLRGLPSASGGRVFRRDDVDEEARA